MNFPFFGDPELPEYPPGTQINRENFYSTRWLDHRSRAAVRFLWRSSDGKRGAVRSAGRICVRPGGNGKLLLAAGTRLGELLCRWGLLHEGGCAAP